MTVRLYGRDVGNGSLAVVTRGFREVLEDAGLLEGFVALDRSGGSEEDESPPGALAHDAVFTGALNTLGAMRIGTKHKRHWVTVTPNSTYIPKELLAAVVDLPNPHILSASAWGTRVIVDTLFEMGYTCGSIGPRESHLFRDNSYKPTKIIMVHHGVSGFAPVAATHEKTLTDYKNGEFRVIHFSTTEGERKGTLKLVQAWRLVREREWLPQKAELLLVLDHHARAALQERMLGVDMTLPAGARLLSRGDLDSSGMSDLLSGMHVLVAPSRGEGFGMIPASARACGVVTVSTRTTGHSAGHCAGPGTIVIPQSPMLAPIDDGPAALAPRVEPVQIAGALMEAFGGWEDLHTTALKTAGGFAREWSWQRQLAPLVELLQ